MEIRIDESGADDLLNRAASVNAEDLFPLHQHACERRPRGIVIPDLGDRFTRVDMPQPDQRLADSARPILEAAVRLDKRSLASHVPRPQHGQGSRDEAPAVGMDGLDHVEIEAAQLRALALGVYRAKQRSPYEIVGDHRNCCRWHRSRR